jgi:hypothetical protein
MLNFISRQENASQDHNEIDMISPQLEWLLLPPKKFAGDDMEKGKKKHLHEVDGNVS